MVETRDSCYFWYGVNITFVSISSIRVFEILWWNWGGARGKLLGACAPLPSLEPPLTKSIELQASLKVNAKVLLRIPVVVDHAVLFRYVHVTWYLTFTILAVYHTSGQ